MDWKEEDKSPHGQSWHTSFHASAFPGDDDSVCGRAQVYGLMNPAPEKPFEPWLKSWFDLGRNLEHDWVRRLSAAGVLLSADVTGEDEFQTGLSVPEIWLTGSPDLIILPPFYKKAHVIEVKTTSHEKVLNMQTEPANVPYSHAKYLRQIKTYIAIAHEKFAPTVMICRRSGTLIKSDKCGRTHKRDCDPVILAVIPPDDGTLIYSSREEPLKTASYYVPYDPEHMKAGIPKLEAWRDYFIKDEIPPHVREGESAKWSEGECKFCDWKKPFCKTDYKNKTKKLTESALVSHTKKIRKNYDPIKTRNAVLERWR